MIWGYPILRNVHLPNYLRNAANKIIEKPFPIFLIHSCAFQIKASLSIAFNHMVCFEIELQPPSKSLKRSTKPQEALGRCTPQHVPWLWILAPCNHLKVRCLNMVCILQMFLWKLGQWWSITGFKYISSLCSCICRRTHLVVWWCWMPIFGPTTIDFLWANWGGSSFKPHVGSQRTAGISWYVVTSSSSNFQDVPDTNFCDRIRVSGSRSWIS
jgi:hypothetical protein